MRAISTASFALGWSQKDTATLTEPMLPSQNAAMGLRVIPIIAFLSPLLS
jgi:hypothetical protein